MSAINHAFLDELDHYIKVKRYRLVNSVVVYENDRLVFERYYNKFTESTTNTLMSTWKSIVSLTMGICIDTGLVKSVDDPISRYLPVFAQNIEPWHRHITLRHLLTMSSGIHFVGGIHYHCPMMEQMQRASDWIEHIADVQMKATPGYFWQYKEWDPILLHAIIGEVYGGTIRDAVDELLYKPLGITDTFFEVYDNGFTDVINALPQYKRNTLTYAGYKQMTARNMAKFGRLMLHSGIWEGKRIVSEKFIHESTQPSKASSGYGYLWWLDKNRYRALGFGGQEVSVYPDTNVVIVVQATATTSGKHYPDISENIIR